MRKNFKFNFSRESFFLTLIVALGAFLRFYKIKDYIVFLGDEGRDGLVVYNILHGHITLLGPTASVGGFFLGPVYYYFMAPFLLLFNYDPVGPAIMVVLFGLATIYLVYRVGKEFFGSKAGLIASLLYSVSGVVVSFSRSSWNPNVMPFFSLLTLFVLYKAELKNNLKLFSITGFLFGITMQLHYLATFLGVIIFFYLLSSSLYFHRTRDLIKKYFLMFLGFLVGFSPFLLFELRHNFTNTINVINFVFTSGETGAGGKFFQTIELVFTRLFGGLVFSYPASSNFYLFDPSLIKIWFGLFVLVSLGSIFYFLRAFQKNKDWLKYGLLILWGVIGIGLFGLYKKPIYDYYLGFLFPLPFILLGFFLSSFLKKPLLKYLAVISIAALAVLSFNFSHLRTEPNRLVYQTQTISDFVLEKTGGRPYNFALLSKSNSDNAYRYFFKLRGRDPVVILPPQVDPERKSTTSQLFVICENLPCSPLGNSQWEAAGFGQADMEQEWSISVVKVYKLVHHTSQ